MWKAELQWRGVTPLHCFGWRKEEPRAMRPIPVRSKKTATFSHWLPSSLYSSKQSQRCRTRTVRTRNQPISWGKVYSHCLWVAGNKPKGSTNTIPSITATKLHYQLAGSHYKRRYLMLLMTAVIYPAFKFIREWRTLRTFNLFEVTCHVMALQWNKLLPVIPYVITAVTSFISLPRIVILRKLVLFHCVPENISCTCYYRNENAFEWAHYYMQLQYSQSFWPIRYETREVETLWDKGLK